MFSHIKYLAMALVGPALFTAWIRTGPDLHHGFYNLYASFVVFCTVFCVFSVGMLALSHAQNQPWRTEKVQELMRSKTYITYLSFSLNLIILIALLWFGKFVIGAILFVHMFLSIFIRHLYLNAPAHKLRPFRADPETEKMGL